MAPSLTTRRSPSTRHVPDLSRSRRPHDSYRIQIFRKSAIVSKIYAYFICLATQESAMATGRRSENYREDVAGRANVRIRLNCSPTTRSWTSSPPARSGPWPTRSSRGSPSRNRCRCSGAIADLRPRRAFGGAGDARTGGAPGDLPEQSRTSRCCGGGRLALFRPADDEAGRTGVRARAFCLGVALHHGRQRRLHHRRWPQDDARA